jgi:adenylate cyclase
MTGFKRFQIRNAMILSNGIANLIGVVVVFYLTGSQARQLPQEAIEAARRVDFIFVPLCFIVIGLLTRLYEIPIRRFADAAAVEGAPPEALRSGARRRLLNEPFLLIALDIGVWMSAAVLYPLIYWLLDAGQETMWMSFFMSFHTGLITTTTAFFVFEFVLQRQVFPYFFPDGGLYAVSGIFRISIRARLVALLFACNLIPFFSILTNVWMSRLSEKDPELILRDLKTAFVDQSFIFIAVAIWVTFLVSSNLTRPLQGIIRVLQQVRKGRFDEKVRVTSNDEIGYAGDVINEMTEGLKERDFIKDTFGKYVSEEIRDEILAGNVPLDGEHKEVTVLFADLRNFTPMVEKTPPKEVVKIINGYFKEMDEAIKQHRGLVLQFIGDEIEAVFGAPLFNGAHPVLAVQAAMQMNTRLQKVNLALEQAGYPRLSHGIGIHTGDVVAANIGSPDRMSYALVGDTVNTASRLQDLNKEFATQIIISETTRARLNGNVPLRELPETRVKGKSGVVRIYAVEPNERPESPL